MAAGMAWEMVAVKELVTAAVMRAATVATAVEAMAPVMEAETVVAAVAAMAVVTVGKVADMPSL